MFKNIGGKIKTLAVILTVIDIIGSIVGGIVLIDMDEGLGATVIVVGILFSWINSFFIYGFGELIENTQKIERNTSSLGKTGTYNIKPQGNQVVSGINQKSSQFTNMSQKCGTEQDKETLYQFAVEQIEKKCYKFSYDALKRIRGYKDSEELLKQIEDKF